MASLKDVKLKITGIRKTKQITKAMFMVASAKLRGAQSRIERFRPYAAKFKTVLNDLAGKTDSSTHPLLQKHAEQRKTVILLATSDRGLCGGFNLTLIAKAVRLAKEKQANNLQVAFICIGKKGRDAIRKAGFEILAAYTDVLGGFDFSLASGIGKEIITAYTSHAIDEVIFVFGEFGSASRQASQVLTILPIESIANIDRSEQTETLASAEYEYEPAVEILLAEILPRFVNVQVYRGLLDTSASEHAARMAAMDNATRNCDDMGTALTLLYNKTRQASITSDLMDIVGGAEALTNA